MTVMTPAVQRTGTIPLRWSIGTVLFTEESVRTVLSADLALTSPLIRMLCGLRVQRTSNFRQSTV